jgi:transposase InsO family protein
VRAHAEANDDLFYSVALQVEASMGSVGESFDNALAKNLWMVIKAECIRGRVFATRAEANLALDEYIDGFCNPRRIQSRTAGAPQCQVQDGRTSRPACRCIRCPPTRAEAGDAVWWPGQGGPGRRGGLPSRRG